VNNDTYNVVYPFISYSHNDSDLKDRVMGILRADGQVDPRCDDSFMVSGADFVNMIYDQLSTASHMIIILTKNYLGSRFCQAELEVARSFRIPIIPVVVGDSQDVGIRGVLEKYCNNRVPSGLMLASISRLESEKLLLALKNCTPRIHSENDKSIGVMGTDTEVSRSRTNESRWFNNYVESATAYGVVTPYLEMIALSMIAASLQNVSDDSKQKAIGIVVVICAIIVIAIKSVFGVRLLKKAYQESGWTKNLAWAIAMNFYYFAIIPGGINMILMENVDKPSLIVGILFIVIVVIVAIASQSFSSFRGASTDSSVRKSIHIFAIPLYAYFIFAALFYAVSSIISCTS